jgi:nucleoside-diphosphate-sugar epimerase
LGALADCEWATPVAASHRTPPPGKYRTQTVRLDATDAAAMGKALLGVDAVVSCIAGDPATIAASARVLFDCCSRLKPAPRIVHMSTMSVYGNADGVLDETAPLKGDASAYSAAKAEAEKLSKGYRSVVHLRPGIVYGPGSPIWSEQIGRLLMARRLGDLGAAGAGVCNLVHVDDVVQATLRALQQSGIEGEAFNLSLPSAPSWNEYFRLYGQALGMPAVSISRERLALELRLLGPALKIAEIFARRASLAWQTPVPIRPWLMRVCSEQIRLDVRKAERLLQMKWMPLECGLRSTASQVLERYASGGTDRHAPA